MSTKFQKGSFEIILLVILGLTAVFSVAAFASKNNPVERPITDVVCKLRPNNIACKTTPPRPCPVTGTNTYNCPTPKPTIAPTPPPPPTPTPTPKPVVQCNPANSIGQVGQPLTFKAVITNMLSGRLNLSWSAPQGNPSTGIGSSFTTTFNSLSPNPVVVQVSAFEGVSECTVNLVQS